jgi:hypothetical protein
MAGLPVRHLRDDEWEAVITDTDIEKLAQK